MAAAPAPLHHPGWDSIIWLYPMPEQKYLENSSVFIIINTFFSLLFFFFPFLPFQSHNGSKPLWIKFFCVFNVIWNLPIVLSPPGCQSLLKSFPLWPQDFLGLIWIFQPQEGRASGTRCPPGLWWALWQRMSPKSWAFHLCTLDLVLTHTQSHS